MGCLYPKGATVLIMLYMILNDSQPHWLFIFLNYKFKNPKNQMQQIKNQILEQITTVIATTKFHIGKMSSKEKAYYDALVKCECILSYKNGKCTDTLIYAIAAIFMAALCIITNLDHLT